MTEITAAQRDTLSRRRITRLLTTECTKAQQETFTRFYGTPADLRHLSGRRLEAVLGIVQRTVRRNKGDRR